MATNNDEFREHNSVIILSDADASREAMLNRILINDGDPATPDTFNNSITDSVNRDVQLEDTLTYIARSASFYTTDKTAFLSHCEGDGIDVITYQAPQLSSGAVTGDVFISDDTFLGAAYPQGYTENMLETFSGVSDISLYPYYNPESGVAKNGWLSSTDLTYQQDFTIAYSQETDNFYTKISTKDITGSAPKTGSIVYKLEKNCLVKFYEDGIKGTEEDPVSPITPTKISASLYFKTADNLVTTKSSIKYKLNFYDSETSTTPIENYGKEITLNDKGEYDGLIKLENISVPTINSGNVYFNVTITVNFTASVSVVDFFLSKVMIQNGEHCTNFVKTSKANTTCQYAEIVEQDFSDNEATLICWSKYMNSSMNAIKSGYYAIGPLFVSFNKTLSIGGVYTGEKTDTGFYISVLVNNNGISDLGDKVLVPNEYKDTYVISALRFRNNDDTTLEEPETIVEYSLVAGEKIYTSTKSIKTSLLTGKGTVVVGYAKDLTATSAYSSYTDYFDGPVTEIRYDKEWVNNYELYALSLSHKPFSYKQSTDSQITTKTKTVTEELDTAGINLLPNPTGRMGYINWELSTDTSNTDIVVEHTDRYLGNCFKLNRSSLDSNKILYSKEIEITKDTSYTLRGMMYAALNSLGDAGIGLRFLTENTVFDPDASTANDLIVKMSATGKAAYYKGTAKSSLDHVKAVVYLFANQKYTSSGEEKYATFNEVRWGKIKLEEGTAATYFTDDSGANYAVYY